MKKFVNNPGEYVAEMLEGIYAAHPQYLKYADNDRHCLVTAQETRPGKVGIVTGGGSGHLPLFLGYVGNNLLDGCAVGDVFQSPSADRILQVTKAVDKGAGVLYLYGNYSGDILNFDMACEMAEMEDIRTLSVRGADDVGSAPAERAATRRGVAGIFFMYKIAGAAAAAGLSLDDVARLAKQAGDCTRTIGIGLSPCIIPEVGHAAFSVAENEMAIGMGIHGEPGISTAALGTADEIIDRILPLLLNELNFNPGDRAAVLLNGLGGTPLDELYILFRRVKQTLDERGITVFHAYQGEYATAMEMTGFSLSLCKLNDELAGYLATSACTPFFSQPELDG